jgi:S1-C subfamily serine protease
MRRTLAAIAVGGLALLFSACSSAGSSSASINTTKSSGISTTSSVGAPANSGAGTLEDSVIAAINKAQPAVVEVTVTEQGGTALGSGSIITSNGYILTNDHVVQNGTSFVVQTSGGTKYTATVAGQDPADDLAVLKITAPKALPTIAFADSTKAQVGQFVVAMGNPLGVGESASFGIISALNRSVSEAPNGPANIIPNAIQTSAPINPGNSGGALIDLSGNLVGIPTLGALDPEFGNAPANGIGFAIPANQAKFIANQIITQGKVTNTGRAFMGVQTSDVTPDVAQYYNLPISSGAIIVQLVAGAPAVSAGLQVNDIIYQVDSTQITNSTDLGSYLATKAPGDQVTVYVNRSGSNKQFKVTLGTLPANG